MNDLLLGPRAGREVGSMIWLDEGLAEKMQLSSFILIDRSPFEFYIA